MGRLLLITNGQTATHADSQTDREQRLQKQVDLKTQIQVGLWTMSNNYYESFPSMRGKRRGSVISIKLRCYLIDQWRYFRTNILNYEVKRVRMRNSAPTTVGSRIDHVIK